MRWEEGVGGHMGRVGGDGDGSGMIQFVAHLCSDLIGKFVWWDVSGLGGMRGASDGTWNG